MCCFCSTDSSVNGGMQYGSKFEEITKERGMLNYL
ncbi:hypothetical protein Desor_3734 [Desulfosporosinus orientis DSM 765]|uniref:Uncharacterized protein n=1 Tax=Desulfosporosinus orientis (strain ATCC 19365 / DSM 765 / NCIMB 8382 / VKM B-1628 / Singapore I) TaxID=768706 RepID=G7W6R8_DESOD|nr:hypothetical protein Desor_3734 [Desulfosporosinus orientis DSM 765]